MPRPTLKMLSCKVYHGRPNTTSTHGPLTGLAAGSPVLLPLTLHARMHAMAHHLGYRHALTSCAPQAHRFAFALILVMLAIFASAKLGSASESMPASNTNMDASYKMPTTDVVSTCLCLQSTARVLLLVPCAVANHTCIFSQVPENQDENHPDHDNLVQAQEVSNAIDIIIILTGAPFVQAAGSKTGWPAWYIALVANNHLQDVKIKALEDSNILEKNKIKALEDDVY